MIYRDHSGRTCVSGTPYGVPLSDSWGPILGTQSGTGSHSIWVYTSHSMLTMDNVNYLLAHYANYLPTSYSFWNFF